MEKRYSLKYFLDLIQGPICICDGGYPQSDVEWRFNDFLQNELRPPFDHAVNLYDIPEIYDLSKYRTISFATKEDYISPKIGEILNFDTSNLYCIVAQNRKAFSVAKEGRKVLDIDVVIIGFDREWRGLLGLYPPEDEYNHPFFDPFTEQLHHMWH